MQCWDSLKCTAAPQEDRHLYSSSSPRFNLPSLIWTCQVLLSEAIVSAEISQN